MGWLPTEIMCLPFSETLGTLCTGVLGASKREAVSKKAVVVEQLMKNWHIQGADQAICRTGRISRSEIL